MFVGVAAEIEYHNRPFTEDGPANYLTIRYLPTELGLWEIINPEDVVRKE